MKYGKLTAEQKAKVNNGCGPAGMPAWLKTLVFSWMFDAQCGHHDFGYTVGGGHRRRAECDLKFGAAMAKDAARNLFNAIAGTILAPTFFVLVFLFGWLFFNFEGPMSDRALSEKLNND